MFPRSRLLLLLVPVLASLVGCSPKIGNKCNLSTDCSQLGDRLCDTTQPEGYCTIFNCEPDTCPDAVCVGFGSTVDPACGTDDVRSPRFQRTFCLKPCDSDGDCRDQYVCVAPTARSAKIVDLQSTSSTEQKVCMVAVSIAAPTPTDHPAVCSPGDAGVPIGDSGVPWSPYTPDGGASGGAGGNGGASGAGGHGGAGGNGGAGGS